MSTAGIELITRNSLNSLRHVSQTSNYLRETLNSQPVDDRSWSWGYLRRQFRVKNLDELYSSYQQRLQHGYFSVFLVLQIVVSLGHISAVVALDGLAHTWPDVVCYVLLMLLCGPLVWLLVQEKKAEEYPCVPFASSCAVVLVMVAADLTLTLHHAGAHDSGAGAVVRPSFTTHSLLACYMFLPLSNNVQVLVLGVSISLCHLVALGSVVYSGQPRLWQKLTSDAVYLICVNFHGLYFRLLNEISLRRTFLDRRACVEATHKLQYEKTQEEHLLLSILPRHIVDSVRDDIRRIIQQIDHPPRKKPFSDMYVKEHQKVSILYADVVNYSQLTVSLPVQKLVEVLNELFGRFDDACEEHGVLRIKFLGDCYNCVSGIPAVNPSHAKSCVRLGLDMISIIKEVRGARRLNDRLNMRIGVHSGKVLSGLLGVCKWQYDIWSQDAIIANHMEQAGIPGHVHVTKDTLLLLENEFQYKPANGNKRNKFLEKHNIETFLIIPNEPRSHTKIEKQPKKSDNNNYEARISFSRRISNGNVRRLTSGRIHSLRGSSAEVASPVSSRRRMAFMDNNLYRYQQTLKVADEQMAEAIRNMPVGVYHRWMFRQTNINPLFLNFENMKWEMPFLRQPDPLFKFYIVSSLAGVVGMMVIQALGSSRHWMTWAGFGLVAGCLLALVPFTWSHYAWNKLKDPHQDTDAIEEPRRALPRLLYAASLRVMWRCDLRFLLYLLLCALLTSCTVLELVECSMDLERNKKAYNMTGQLNATVLMESHWLEECLAPWNVTESCMLVMIVSFMFLRIHFLLKLVVCVSIFAVYTYGIWSVNPQLFTYGETMNPGMKPAVAHTLCVLFLGTTLHMLDRQTEYINRLDYKWKRQLSEEQDEGAITHMVNKMLLENILPIHVAKLYLNTNRAYGELYHEEYETVAVMFATITDYALFSEHESERLSQLSSLKMLNQIICDFDKLLFEPSFLRVEKIKMAGWTYMAACGLDSGRRDSTVSMARVNVSEHVVVVMARFAAMMMRVLQENNRESFQNFRLRVGISHGEVTAGVVGSHKPLYDIWGDAVNMASRMDSTGEPGRIQVTEETAVVLRDQQVSCQCRGLTYVKNKGDMMTYFVDIDSNFNLIESRTPVHTFHQCTDEENTRL
ncbi:adenylate cyclase type 2-like isoform X2 [Bacillus rossius redtenbacheri]|uniref:adenylate cyclase type 2-like isoform X2 n=1 Tax=Bacillus rossius redtenbacheri TaxID=93214 RepID=UPI002FDEA978